MTVRDLSLFEGGARLQITDTRTSVIADFVAWSAKRSRSVRRASGLAETPTTNVGRLLALLKHNERMTTVELATRSGLNSRQVWGLLKTPRSFGQVQFDDGHWEIDREYQGNDVARAASLLRSKGWFVEAPTIFKEGESNG